MKLSRIALATAATCGALASLPAFAITANNYTNTGEFTGDTLNIRMSGATAQDPGIVGSALSLCQAGTLTAYTISNNFVYYCNPDVGNNAGQIQVPQGKTKLAWYKYSVGGSASGVAPIQSNTVADGSALTGTGNQLPFLDLTKIAALCTGTFATTTTVSFGSTLGTYTQIACGNASGALTTLATTYVGLSDVEPAFFFSPINNITTAQASALIFAPRVSLVLRNKLQALQGKTVGDDTAANMPSLTSAQLVSAFTQLGQTWTGIGIPTGFADDGIYVARRVDSSGTQKTFEALIARTPNGTGFKSCAINTEPFVGPDSGNTTTGDNASVCSGGTPSTVFAGSGDGDVRTCLANHNTAGRAAIGIGSTEAKAGSAGWRYVAVDGVIPSQSGAASGAYRHYTETAINTRAGGALSTAGALGYPAFVSRLSADLANPTIITAINGTAQPFGAAGLMALISRTGTTPDFTGASSVIPYTKLVGGSNLDNCQAPKVVF